MVDASLQYYDFCKVRMRGITPSMHRYLSEELPQFLSEPLASCVQTDLEIEIVDKITPSRCLSFVGPTAAFDTEHFYVFDWPEHAFPYKAAIRLRDIQDSRFYVSCEKGFDPARFFEYLLEPLVRCVALTKGVVFVHASSVIYEERTYLFPAWGHTGKTSLVLFLLDRGAMLLSDEWSILSSSGRLLSYPKAIRADGYTLRTLPALRRAQDPWRAVALSFFDFLHTLDQKWGDSRRRSVHKFLVFLLRIATSVTQFKIPTYHFQEYVPDAAPLENLFFLVRGNVAKPLLKEISLAAVVRKVAASYHYEDSYLWNSARSSDMYRYAFPEVPGELWESDLRYEEVLSQGFQASPLRRLGSLVLPKRLTTSALEEVLRLLR